MTETIPKQKTVYSSVWNDVIARKKSTTPWSFENLLMILPDGFVWKNDKGAVKTDDNIIVCNFVNPCKKITDDIIKKII